MNEVHGACRRYRKKYSSSGRVAFGIGLALRNAVASVGSAAANVLPQLFFRVKPAQCSRHDWKIVIAETEG